MNVATIICMSYAVAVEQLYALSGELVPSKPGAPLRKFELDHMRVLAAGLGDPQKQFRCVLIAGTNGKGSTCATLASVMTASGYKTGLYTSPHLVRVNERVEIAGAQIDDDTFARLYFQVDDVATKLVAEGRLPHSPSFFEVITALAFLAFAEAKVDVAVLEVGLGGRLDATNIVEPMLSVITDISLDHTDWLGNTITEIAREKAGILRQGGTLVTLPQHPEANVSIGEVAVSLDVTGVNAAAYLPDRALDPEQPFPVAVLDEVIEIAHLPGEHQHRNTALAIATAVELKQRHGYEKVTPSTIAAGIRETKWPGRLMRVDGPQGSKLLLDVAHNPAGAWTLRSYLSRVFANGGMTAPRTLVFSALNDKSVREMAQILFPLFEEPGDRIVLAPIQSPRASTAEELAGVAAALETKVIVCASLPEALSVATADGGSVVVSGSVYLVGEAMVWLKQATA